METAELLKIIFSSTSFSDIRNSGILPEPDSDDGYYFVSYSHVDYKHVLPEIIEFQNMGLKIWYDRGLESGKSWIAEVKKKISSYYCKGVIIYLSKNYFNSNSCILELAHIIHEQKHCLNVLIDDECARLNSEALSEIHFEEFFKSYPVLQIDLNIEEKIKIISQFPEPELFEFQYLDYKPFKLFKIHSCHLSRLLDTNVEAVTIPRYVMNNGKKYKVREILPNAFSNCEMLEEVTVPKGWTKIWDGAFVNCPSLRIVRLDRPITFFSRISRAFIHCDNIEQIICPKGKMILERTYRNFTNLVEIKMPKNYIGSTGCFMNCNKLQAVELSKRTSIAARIFEGCISLKSVIIPKNSFAREVDYYAFYDCISLEKIVLQRRIKVINEYAFKNCVSLKEINIPKHVRVIESSAFENCNSLESIIIDCKINKILENRSVGKTTLDLLFPNAKKFYLKKRVHMDVFTDKFLLSPKKEKGYFIYCKEVA